MKRLAFLLAWTSLAHAGSPSPEKPVPAAPPPPPGYAPITLLDGRLTVDIQEKMRAEIRENNFDFNSAVNGPQDASWLLQRFRLGLGYSFSPWFKIYVQGQDVREIGGSRPNEIGVFGAEGDDTFDILKAYVQMGDVKKGASATVGRQFLSYGDQRLIGPLEWLNQARTWDAVKLRYAAPQWSVDLFSGSPVVYKDHEWNKSTFLDDDDNLNEIFSGLYVSTQLIPIQTTTDFYVLHKMNDGTRDFGPRLGDTNFFTIGTLWKGDPKKLRGWDYEMEMALQKGEVNGRELNAFAGHWGIGYNFNHTWKPRLGLQYNYATGDQDPGDGRIETFQNLYPTNHLFYGYMDTTGWVNMHNPQLNFSIMPTPKLKVMLDYHLYWNATNDDAWRRVNGVTAVRPVNAAARDASPFRGQEVDLTLMYKLNPHIAFQAGYSLYIAGDYLSDTGAADNAHFGYVQVQIDF